MESGIDADATLDYATIQIFPAHNRYEIFVCGGDEVEKLATGLLEHLLPHLPGVNKLYAKGSSAIFKLQMTGESEGAEWFTKSTLKRFLQFVGSSAFLKTIKNIEGEIIQLEEARKLHLSLYAQGNRNNFETEGSADSSKNELLRAIDLRLTALRTELCMAVKQNANGSVNLSEEIMNLVQFCEFFGATELRNSLSKFPEVIPKSEPDLLVKHEKKSLSLVSNIDSNNMSNGEIRKTKPSPALTPVKYGVSPAKAAQVERQSSTDSEESSESSDEQQVSAERSRSVTRSAQPRRSASPMRRVQIGRSGARRATAVAIKSLGYYPARDRGVSHIDAAANSSEDEDERTEEPGNKPENHVRRMSVQDKINLFESKQKDQGTNVRNSSSNISLFANKSVLRRWSAGVADSGPHQSESISQDSTPLPCNDEDVTNLSKDAAEEKMESESASTSQDAVEIETTELGKDQMLHEKGEDDLVNLETKTDLTRKHENNGKVAASAEWTRQKEAEFNQLLKKMMEYKPPEQTRKLSAGAVQSVSSEKRGGSYNSYKEKRDQKLREENNGKRAEKEVQIRAMQQILNQGKAQMTSAKSKDAVKRDPVRRTQKSMKDTSQPANIRSDSPKATVAKKVAPKTSTLPATRKSWPSAPSANRVASSSPFKIPAGTSSAGTTPTRRKPQSTTSVPRPNAKVEKPQPRLRNARGTQTDNDKNSKVVKEKVQQRQTKNEKTTKTAKPAKPKVVDSTESLDTAPSKPSFYNKMTKKSSIVPLESKPRKASGMGPGAVSSANKIKRSSKSDESLTKSEPVIESKKTGVVANDSVEDTTQPEVDSSPAHIVAAVEPVALVRNHDGDVTENINEVVTDGNTFNGTAESPASVEPPEESSISPSAWVEEIEEQHGLINSYNYIDTADASQKPSIDHVSCVEPSSPCVRHSLSQMLQDESYESDNTEWGNAENPPSMIYQKDVPKGFKRLLKFARKNKGDANLAGWSSPSVISGEDDGEESKAVSERNTENLLRKAALHSAQSSMSKNDAWSLPKSQKVHVSDTTSTTKASKSFFSLSAFRGSKPNDAKFL